MYHFYSIVEICNMNLSTSTTKKNKSNLIFLWQYLYYEQRICLDYGTIRIRSIILEYGEWSHCIFGQSVLWSMWIKIQDMIHALFKISFIFGRLEWFILLLPVCNRVIQNKISSCLYKFESFWLNTFNINLFSCQHKSFSKIYKSHHNNFLSYD